MLVHIPADRWSSLRTSKSFATGKFLNLNRYSWVLPTAWSQYSTVVLGTAYILVLIWLFVGISIISDIFMEGIEVITSKKVTVYVNDHLGYRVPKKVAVWNPTVANLTLMALGSSAPEILLNVIETLKNLGKVPGELGPSTIVGSAAFNLLLISAVSIYSVSESNDERTEYELIDDGNKKGIKKIKDLGVYGCTTLFSLFSYIWLYVCLLDGEVDPVEAWLTLAYFFAMIGAAYVFDIVGARKARKEKVDLGPKTGETDKPTTEIELA